MEASAKRLIQEAAVSGNLFVSTASAWEIGLLARHRAGQVQGLQFLPDPQTWFGTLMARPGIRLAALTPEIAIDASHLPGEFHNDPADRMIVATARRMGASVVTRDSKILDYARTGRVESVAC